MMPQEIFDTVARALIKQGCASTTTDGKCLYRGPNGTKCAAGHLIPDELYNGRMEEYAITLLITKDVDRIFPTYMRDNISLINKLQQAHDRYLVQHDGMKLWKNGMKNIAETFSLNYDVLFEEDK